MIDASKTSTLVVAVSFCASSTATLTAPGAVPAGTTKLATENAPSLLVEGAVNVETLLDPNIADNVEVGAIPVRFVGTGPYSLDVEVTAYVKTSNFDEFLAVQQELLLAMLQAIERAGTALAVPLQESFELQKR